MRCVKLISAVIFAATALASCTADDNFDPARFYDGSSVSSNPQRLPIEEVRHVMIMVAGGYNSLSEYIRADMKELSEGYLPTGKGRMEDVLVVLSRLPEKRGDYSTPSPVILYRLWKGSDGNVVRDTLYKWDTSAVLSDASTIGEALQMVSDMFPAAGYGMVFSSHASGWLPAGYYNDPAAYEEAHGGDAGFFGISRRGLRETFPPIPDYPAVKSIGQDKVGSESYEMELKDLSEAIPIHLEYLLFDACLNGCVEVAYAFRGIADIVGFSPTEVLADGFDYPSIAKRLLRPQLNPVAVCKDYFAYYDAQSGSGRSATITVVDTRKMEPLAEVCADLFDRYRDKINSLDGNRVQGYFRSNRHYFYDLKDILVRAGMTAEETALLDQAMSKCIVYKAATPSFLGIDLSRANGLSMYLPSMGTPRLDKFYKDNMAWNEATQLVK